MPEMTYLEAISDGLREEMRRDESVFCMGEDIGAFGGAFKVTDGFIEEFGAERVLDTPLAENAIIGTAVGAAIEGLRPVCEMQFADFISCGFDQLVNVAAKLHYRQGVAVPIVVRLPSRRRLLRRPVPLPEPGGVVPAVARAEGRGAGDRRRRQGPADGARSATRTRSATSSTRASTATSRARCPRASTWSPLGKARVAREGEEMTRDRLRLRGAPRARGRRGARRGRSR